MDDMIYRNDSIAEENIDPNGRPAENKFEEWSEEVSERTDPGCKDKKVKSAKERKKLIREMDEVIKEDLKKKITSGDTEPFQPKLERASIRTA